MIASSVPSIEMKECRENAKMVDHAASQYWELGGGRESRVREVIEGKS